MARHNPANERIKHDYFKLLKEARGYDDASINSVASSLDRFEAYTRYKGFDRFHIEQAIGFKRAIAEERNKRTDRPLSKSTVKAILRALREFFIWLAGQPGFRSRMSFSDSEYFKLSDKETRAANAATEPPVPSVAQIIQVLRQMPGGTAIQRRDRAVMAFILLTGARDNAVASLKLKHVDLVERMVFQDPREVRTKASKAINTWFFPVGDLPERLLRDWIEELRIGLEWTDEDPLFPATMVAQNSQRRFTPVGFRRNPWSNADPIRKIFRHAFASAALPYFNPHSFRKTIARLGERICKTPEEFKAWSQNLGHEQVSTTLTSYGAVPAYRQAKLIRDLENAGRSTSEPEQIAQLLARLGWRPPES